MTDDAPRAEVACGEWSKPRRLAARAGWRDEASPVPRPRASTCSGTGRSASNPGGPEPVLPTGLPCELHSSPDWAWRSPGKQNGDPRHSCSDAEFTIATRPRPRAHEPRSDESLELAPPSTPQQITVK